MSPAHRRASALLLLALAVLCTERLVPAAYERLPAEWRQWDRVETRKETVRRTEGYDVLALGDSTAIEGVIPDEFRALTGLSMFNFATYSDRVAAADPYFLRAYLQTHPAPKAVVVVRSIHSWATPFSFDIYRQQLARPDLSARLLSLGAVTWPQYAHLLLEQVFPSLLYREKLAHVRETVLHPELARQNLDDLRTSTGQLGYEPFDYAKHATNLELNAANMDYIHALRKDGKTVIDPMNLALFADLCRTAQEHGVPLYVTWGPMAGIFNQDPDALRAQVDIAAAVGAAIAEYPVCSPLRLDHFLDDGYLSDLTHTNDGGAKIFTQRLADAFMQAENPGSAGR
jgi:hypothetical protein